MHCVTLAQYRSMTKPTFKQITFNQIKNKQAYNYETSLTKIHALGNANAHLLQPLINALGSLFLFLKQQLQATWKERALVDGECVQGKMRGKIRDRRRAAAIHPQHAHDAFRRKITIQVWTTSRGAGFLGLRRRRRGRGRRRRRRRNSDRQVLRVKCCAS